ncbi:MAG: hypothetical protein E7458_06215 [Ruminococcaceae bacterium]|nr:hypothetical protein [Oscillospiraceae bacterium]
MAKMTYVKVFVTFRQDVARLSFEEIGRLFVAMLLYAEEDVEMELPGLEGILWPNVKRLIDEEERKYRELCERNKKNRAMAEVRKMEKSVSLTTRDQEQEKEKEYEQEQEHTPPIVPREAGASTADARAREIEGDHKIESLFKTQELRDAVRDWMIYKQEKRQPYEPMGQEILIRQLRDAADQHGEYAVAAELRTSMASNYQGIVFSRIGQDAAKPRYGTPLPSSAAPSPGWDTPDEAYCRMVREELARMGSRES